MLGQVFNVLRLRECLTKHVVIVVIAVTVTDSNEEMRLKEHVLPKSRLLVGVVKKYSVSPDFVIFIPLVRKQV